MSMLGKGSFGCVYLATLKNRRSKYHYLPSVTAVKSDEVSISGLIQKEREVFNNIKDCPCVIRCFGDETTIAKMAPWCTTCCLSMLVVEPYLIGSRNQETKDCLNLSKGSTEFMAKIADLGLAKKEKSSKKRRLEPYWRGTPMYLSPEAVIDNVQECPADIWALGCVVLEMLTGKPPWNDEEDMDVEDVLRKIGEGIDLPEIPVELSKEAKSFLKSCFVRKPRYRWTAEMLLNHPFVEGLIDDDGVEDPEEVEDIAEVEPMTLVTDKFSYSSSEPEEVEDINEVECMTLVTDEFFDFSEDWRCISDEDSLGYWSEEDLEAIEEETCSYFVEEGIVEVEESTSILRSMIDNGFDCLIDTSIQVPLRSPSTNSRKCPLNFIIPAGI